MKFWVMVLVLLPLASIGQIERSGTPLSVGLEDYTYNTYDLPEIPVEELFAEDVVDEAEKSYPYRFAHPFHLNLNPNEPVTPSNPWTWLPLDNSGSGFWVISIQCPNAIGLGLTFDQFFLEKGTRMVIFNEDMDEVIGDLTYRNNNSANKLGTIPLTGDRIFVEIYVPAGKVIDINIEAVSCSYKELGVYTSEDECMSDPQCHNPESIKSQMSSVVRILSDKGSRSSTGVLINSNTQQSKPYIITSSKNLYGDPSTWSFVFNYKSEDCDDETLSDQFLMCSGCEIVAESEETDLVLLSLLEVPTEGWNAFYNGWNRSSLPPEQSFSVHHAFGGKMKFAENDQSFEIDHSLEYDVWKQNYWVEGSMQAGSLGAPLFDANGLIRGFFVGGDIRCDVDDELAVDRFIPFYECWSDFKMFLDPQNNSPSSFAGRESQIEPISNLILNQSDAIYPNPAVNRLFWYSEDDEAVERIDVVSAQGQLIECLYPLGNSQELIVDHLPRGWYIFNVVHQSYTSSHKVVLK